MRSTAVAGRSFAVAVTRWATALACGFLLSCSGDVDDEDASLASDSGAPETGRHDAADALGRDDRSDGAADADRSVDVAADRSDGSGGGGGPADGAGVDDHATLPNEVGDTRDSGVDVSLEASVGDGALIDRDLLLETGTDIDAGIGMESSSSYDAADAAPNEAGSSDAGSNDASDASSQPDQAADVSADVPADVALDPLIDAPPENVGEEDAEAAIEASLPLDASGSSYLTIVAHPDDDLLFFNPDLEAAVRGGASSRVLYVTSGDASGQPWPMRETGIMSAAAAIARATDSWQCGSAIYVGHAVERCVLTADPRISAVFLRLPDSMVGALWGPPLRAQVNSLARIDDPSTTYTESDIISVMIEIMRDVAATHVLTMDSTFAYAHNFDHPDHVAVGLFALLAAQSYGRVDTLHIYRGYTTSFAPINLTQADFDEKARLMSIYGDEVVDGGPYVDWAWRQYTYASVGGTGQLRQPNGDCLEGGAEGATVALAPCSASAAQTWVAEPDGSITGLQNRCLTADSSSIVVATCTSAPEQRWTWFDNGQLRGPGATCVTANGSSLSLAMCDADSPPEGGVLPTQMWVR